MSHVLTKTILRHLRKKPRTNEYFLKLIERRNLSQAENPQATLAMTMSRLKSANRVSRDGQFWTLAESIPVKRKYTKRTKPVEVAPVEPPALVPPPMTTDALTVFINQCKTLGKEKVTELLSKHAEYSDFYSKVAQVGGVEQAQKLLEVVGL